MLVLYSGVPLQNIAERYLDRLWTEFSWFGLKSGVSSPAKQLRVCTAG
jgi:hypothetical protein